MKKRVWALAGRVGAIVRTLLGIVIALVVGVPLVGRILKSDTPLDPVLTIVGIVVVFGLVEHSWRGFFPRTYFKFGIPLLRRAYSVFQAESLAANFAALPNSLSSMGKLPRIDVLPLSDVEYGLWASEVESQSWPSKGKMTTYNPLTRGFLVLDKDKNSLKLSTYLNWSTLPLLIIWFGFFLYVPLFCFVARFAFMGFGVYIIAKLFEGETKQYLRLWEAVKRYSYGQYDMGEIKRMFS